MFRILYLLVIPDPPSWVAYVHTAVIFGLMGLVYVQGARRRMRFMPMFGAMAGVFMIDLLGYLPFLAYIVARDRRPAGVPERPPR
ncbi:MAG: hypothetical protein M5U22_05190 [Thermoleophilia bacterium]|nr:hypothetical protein [Thermoleophilia bacterium]